MNIIWKSCKIRTNPILGLTISIWQQTFAVTFVNVISIYHFYIRTMWGSNSRPSGHETDALPTALTRLTYPRKLNSSHLMSPGNFSGFFPQISFLYLTLKPCPVWGSNSRPSDYETDALPTALTRLIRFEILNECDNAKEKKCDG